MKGDERALYGGKIAEIYDEHVADLGIDDPGTNAAAHPDKGGYFMLEAFVPDTKFFDRGQKLHVKQLTAERIDLEATVHDSVKQRVYGQSVQMSEDGGIKMYPVDIRYAYPAELDLMARLAGLALRKRWGGWRREFFTVASTTHVSLYQKPRQQNDSAGRREDVCSRHRRTRRSRQVDACHSLDGY